MSEKCANVFYLTDSVEECKGFLKVLDALPTRDAKKDYLALWGAMANQPPTSPQVLKLLEPFFNLISNARIRMVHTGRALLLTSEVWTWGEAYLQACEISRKLSIACLAVDYKDYGVFVLHLIENGEVVSKFASGEELPYYGFEKASIDFDSFAGLTGCGSPELERAFADGDKERIIKLVSDLVGIDCTAAYDDLQELLKGRTPVKSGRRCELFVL